MTFTKTFNVLSSRNVFLFRNINLGVDKGKKKI